MTRNRLLIIICAVLLFSNVVLAFALLRRPPSSGLDPDRPKRYIIEKLRFDEQQQQQYSGLVSEHRTRMHVLQRKIMQNKNSLYELLPGDDLSRRDSLLDVAEDLQRQIETLHFEHFLAIKKICRPQQLKLFAELSTEIAGLFNPPPPKEK